MKLGGLNLNKNYNEKETYQWNYAKNIVIKNGTISNEEGFEKINFQNIDPLIQLQGDSRLETIGGIIINNRIFLWQTGDRITISNGTVYTTQVSRLVMFENNTHYILFSTSYIKFDRNNPIEVVYRYNYKNELILVWNNGNDETSDVLRYINVDKQIKENYLDFNGVDFNNLEKADNLLRLFPLYKTPTFVLKTLPTTSGKLKPGAYIFTICYKILDDDYTDIVHHSNSIFIYGDSTKQNELISTKSILLNLYNLDTNYESFKLICITNIDGAIQAYNIGEYKITSNTFTLTINELNDKEIFTDYNSLHIRYHKSNTLTVFSDKLWLGNVTSSKFIDYQKFANNIEVFYEYGNALTYNTDKLEDIVVTLDDTSLPYDEVIALYIYFILKDGSLTPAYHIPGRPADRYRIYGSNGINIPYLEDVNDSVGNPIFENSEILENGLTDDIFNSDEFELSAVNKIKVFHVRDTAIQDFNKPKDFRLGYWENEDEYYPDTEDFDVWTVDPYGNPVPQYKNGNPVTLRNQKVRHHKTPSYQSLYAYNYSTQGYSQYNRSLKLKFRNIAIPKEYKKDIYAIGFAYAKIDIENRTNFGASVILPSNFYGNYDWSLQSDIKEARVYPLDLLEYNSRAKVKIDYFKGIGGQLGSNISPNYSIYHLNNFPSRLLTYYRNGNTFRTFAQNRFALKNALRIVDINNYFPENNSAVKWKYNNTVSNQNNEECLSILGKDDKNSPRYPSNPNPILNWESFLKHNFREYCNLVTLHSIKKNVYSPFYKQELVSFGVIIPIHRYNPNGEEFIYGNPYGIYGKEGYEWQYVLNSEITDTLEYIFQYPCRLNTYFAKGDIVSNSAQLYSKSLVKYVNVTAHGFYIAAFSYNSFEYTNFEFLERFDGGNSFYLFGIQANYSLNQGKNVRLPIHYRQYNTLLTPIIYNPFRKYININKNRVVRSITLSKEGSNVIWRKFKPLSYYNFDNGYEIIKLLSKDNILYIQLKDRLFIADVSSITDITELSKQLKEVTTEGSVIGQIGITDILKTPKELLESNTGEIGCVDKLAISLNKHGYFVFDRVKKKIWNVSVSNVLDLTSLNVKDFILSNISDDKDNSILSGRGALMYYDDFNDRVMFVYKDKITKSFELNFANTYLNRAVHFNYNNSKYLYLKISKYSAPFTIKIYYNNFNSTPISTINVPTNTNNEYYTIVPIYNQFIICIENTSNATKCLIEISESNVDGIYTDNSFTLSYLPSAKKFISLHDYNPNIVIDGRNNLILVKNSYKQISRVLSPNHIELLNASEIDFGNVLNKFGIFFENKLYPSFIDIIFNSGVKQILESVIWKSQVINTYNNNIDELDTVDFLMVYNQYQCSGLIDILSKSNLWFSNEVARYIDGIWYYNNFKDFVVDKTIPFLDKDMQPNSNVNRNGVAWFNASDFINNIFIIRLQYSNKIFGFFQKKLYISDCTIKQRQSYR